MKRNTTIILSAIACQFIFLGRLFSQKPLPVIDSGIIKKWNLLSPNIFISNDGKFVNYGENNQPEGTNVMVLKACDGSWEKRIVNGQIQYPNIFSQDSKYGFFLNGDTLNIQALGSNSKRLVLNVAYYIELASKKAPCLLVHKQTEQKSLYLINLKDWKEVSIPEVSDFVVNKEGNSVILIKELADSTQQLSLFSVDDQRSEIIWKGQLLGGITFNQKGTKFAFCGQGNEASDSPNPKKTIWEYEYKSKMVVPKFDTSFNSAKGTVSFSIDQYSFDDKVLLLSIKREVTQNKGNKTSVDVWNYQDRELQSAQLAAGPYTEKYSYALQLEDRQLISLTEPGEEVRSESQNGRFRLITQKSSSGNTPGRLHHSYFLLDLLTKEKKQIDIPEDVVYFPALAPDGKYVLYFDLKKEDYFGLDLATGNKLNLTKGIVSEWLDKEIGYNSLLYGRGAWLTGTHIAYINDRYDVWQVDVSGSQSPKCITNFEGKNRALRFRFSKTGNIDSTEKEIFFSVFDVKTKDNGFYKVRLGDPSSLTKLVMAPFLFHIPDNYLGTEPIKAANASTWIVSRQTAEESANYFITRDFKKFQQLSFVNPEKQVNWLTADLITYPIDENRTNQAIVYKPKNFNASRKYPVIFTYYENATQTFHEFLKPDFSPGNINIPWFVSRGYVVVLPDIFPQVGHPGESALQSVLGAAKYVGRYPWIDTLRMAITGHSYGGFETNYIVTRTNKFVAAFSASGPSDFVSGYNAVLPFGGISYQGFYEVGQLRMGATIWENPDAYIENSPVLKADKVNTPLLLMNNKGDAIVPFSQGVEFFTALRRLGKRVWMLQYDGEVHALTNDQNSWDLTKRVTQFFDHYLKGAPAPVWMTRGIPARDKTLVDGFETSWPIEAQEDRMLKTSKN
jgi:dipeptidyl aminopeptidase/acylaminoacyl peptidase